MYTEVQVLCGFDLLLSMHSKDQDARIIELAMYESDARKVVCEVGGV